MASADRWKTERNRRKRVNGLLVVMAVIELFLVWWMLRVYVL
jgi:hypothetical protein